MRNVSKNNKFLLCFHPDVDIDSVLDSNAAVHHDRPAPRGFSCIPLADKHSETKSKILDQGCPKFTENFVKPQPSKRTLPRLKVIKAVVFETILNRRVHKKTRDSQDCFGSKRSYSTYPERSSTGDDKSLFSPASVDTNFKENKAPETSSSSPSSIPPEYELKKLSEYYSPKEKQKQSSGRETRDQLEKQKKFDCFGIYLFLLSLALTVLLGKIHGIISMSIWLCFFSIWKARNPRPKEVSKLRKKEFKVYKNNRGHKGRSDPKELP